MGQLADPEPDDEQEDQGRVGHHPEHLHRCVQELLPQAVEAHDDAEDEAHPGAEGEAQHGAANGDADVADQVLVAQEVHESVPGGARCRERRRRNRPWSW